MADRRNSVTSILSRLSKGSEGSDKQSVHGLTDKVTVTKNEKKTKGTKIEEDNRMHSFTPAGIPKSEASQRNSLVYKWDKTRGNEHNARDPINKPLTVPIDDAYLSILPQGSSKTAWLHMQSKKKRPSLEDYNNTPEIAAAVAAEKNVIATETPNPSIEPFEMEPAPSAVDPWSPGYIKESTDKLINDLETFQTPKPVTQPRPPWNSSWDDESIPKQPSSAASSAEFCWEEFLTFEMKRFCGQVRSKVSPCTVPVSRIRRYRHARKCKRGDEDEIKQSMQPCCAHSKFKVIPGNIRRSLPWAPCASIPRLLLICQDCGAAFREKTGIEAGKNLALVEFCGYAAEEEDNIVFHLDPLLAGFESVYEEVERPRRAKCPCQRCRRKRRKIGDHFPDCECQLCLKRLSKCLNKGYYAWNYRNCQDLIPDDDNAGNRRLQDPWDADEREPEKMEELAIECDCPECRRRRRQPGDHFTDCDCQFCNDRKTKCLRYTLNKRSDTEGDDIEAESERTKSAEIADEPLNSQDKPPLLSEREEPISIEAAELILARINAEIEELLADINSEIPNDINTTETDEPDRESIASTTIAEKAAEKPKEATLKVKAAKSRKAKLKGKAVKPRKAKLKVKAVKPRKNSDSDIRSSDLDE